MGTHMRHINLNAIFSLSASDKLFGGDLEHALKSANEPFKLIMGTLANSYNSIRDNTVMYMFLLGQHGFYSNRGTFCQNMGRAAKHHMIW